MLKKLQIWDLKRHIKNLKHSVCYTHEFYGCKTCIKNAEELIKKKENPKNLLTCHLCGWEISEINENFPPAKMKSKKGKLVDVCRMCFLTISLNKKN